MEMCIEKKAIIVYFRFFDRLRRMHFSKKKMNNILKKHAKLSVQAKSSIAYTIANFISKGLSIITVPIFTRMMSSSEIGIGTTYSSWYTILYAIITLSLCSGSINIGLMEYKDRRDEYEASCLTLSSIMGILSIVILQCFKNKIIEITTLDYSLLLFLFISLIINPALDFWYARQRFEYKYKSSAFASITISVLSALISVITILVLKKQGFVELGKAKVISQGTVLMLGSLTAYVYILSRKVKHFNVSIWKYAILISAPLIIHTLSKNILDVSDKIMISRICGKSEAGIYGTVYSISMISLLVWNAINASLIPLTFEKLNENDKYSLDKIYLPVLTVFGVVSIIITLFAPEILYILAPNEYGEAVYLVPALSAGMFFTALYNIYGNLLLYKKKTVSIMIASFFAAVTNLSLNHVFIQRFGYVAAAYTTFFSFVLLALAQGAMVRHAYKRNVLNDKLYFLLATVVSALSLICNFLYDKKLLRFITILFIFIWAIIYRKRINAVIKNINHS